MPTTPPTLTPVVGVPSTIPASQLGTLTGVAVYDGPYNGGPTGLGLGTIAFKWDTGSSGWVTLDASPVALTLPVARGDILGSTQPHGWLLIDLSWTDISGQRQTKRLQFRPQAGPGQVLDLTADQAPIAYTTPQSLVDLMNSVQAAGTSATAAGARADTATAGANTATATANTAATAADTARGNLTTQVTAALATNTSTLNASIASQNNTISSGLALALTASNIQRYATAAERNAASPADGTWAFTTGTGEYHRREAGAWVLRGSATTFVSGTRAQRQAFTPSVITDYRETDTHVTLTYYPGTGWRDVYGNNPDAAAPPPDTGVY
ncbi:hypothetical protein Q0M94_02125 [Deinococcus radiomollis]|uniref:hypothetical protein n=1 Tax=Deinococcus radiomollis TaxID=468916 RepID=UPI003892B534